MIKGPFTFIVTSRGCPVGCGIKRIKHVSYQNSVRAVLGWRNIVEELEYLALGITNIHMYADLFTVNRDHVVEPCKLIIEALGSRSAGRNSRADYVDEEMLDADGAAGCWLISLGVSRAPTR